MKDSRALQTQAAGRFEADFDPIAKASRRVGTSRLKRSGIEHVRVLSESRFLKLVEELVEAELEKRIGERTPPLHLPDDAPASLRALRAVFDSRWRELRAHASADLEKMERRLEALGATFRALESTLKRLEGGAEPDSVERPALFGEAVASEC